MSNPETEAGSLTRTLKDLFAGAAGGVAQVLLGEQRGFIVPVLNSTNEKCLSEWQEILIST